MGDRWAKCRRRICGLEREKKHGGQASGSFPPPAHFFFFFFFFFVFFFFLFFFIFFFFFFFFLECGRRESTPAAEAAVQYLVTKPTSSKIQRPPVLDSWS